MHHLDGGQPHLAGGCLGDTVRAGTIASSIGNAMVTPRPRSTVRREMCFFVMNIGSLLIIPGIDNRSATDLMPDLSASSRSARDAPIRNAALLATPEINAENR